MDNLNTLKLLRNAIYSDKMTFYDSSVESHKEILDNFHLLEQSIFEVIGGPVLYREMKEMQEAVRLLSKINLKLFVNLKLYLIPEFKNYVSEKEIENASVVDDVNNYEYYDVNNDENDELAIYHPRRLNRIPNLMANLPKF